MRKLEVIRDKGCNIAIFPDGYIHHAIIKGRVKFPYEIQNGEYKNVIGLYRIPEFKSLVSAGKAVWG